MLNKHISHGARFALLGVEEDVRAERAQLPKKMPDF
jgi:hypothetical protein